MWFLLDGDLITKAVVSRGTGSWENLQLSVLDDVLKNDPNVHNHAVVSGYSEFLQTHPESLTTSGN